MLIKSLIQVLGLDSSIKLMKQVAKNKKKLKISIHEGYFCYLHSYLLYQVFYFK